MRKRKRSKALFNLAKRKRGIDRRKLLLELAGGKCLMCGYSEFWALEFHHVEKKRFTLSSRTLGMIADEKLIMSEFRRCVLLCANCHKGIHYGGLKEKLVEAIQQREGVI